MISDCLAGLRILDLSLFIPGPFATLWLSDLGAEVVKIESPAGDPLRTMGPLDPDGTTCFYKLANRNKRVVTLDLKTDDGRRAFARLAEAADVLLEGFRPGTLARLGFDSARLTELNPRLIQCALSGYGATGPLARRAGHDLTYLAASGLLAATGTAGHPVMPFPPLADHAGAMLAVNAILAALLKRGRTGRGCRLDVSLAEAALSWMGGVLTMARRWGGPLRETGLIDGGAAFYRVYRTSDGRFAALAALEERYWSAFCRAAGREEWIHRHRDPLPQHAMIAELDTLFATRTLVEWEAIMVPHDCTFEPVVEPSDIAMHPHHRARDFVQTDDAGGLVEVLLPILMDEARPLKRRQLVDTTVDEVLAEWS